MKIRKAILDAHKDECITFQQLADLWGVSKQAIRTKMIRWGLYRKSPLIGCYVDREELRKKLLSLTKKKENKK